MLASLATGLLNRRLFKAVDVTNTLSPGVVKFSEIAKQLVETAGYHSDYALASDTPSDTAYKLYNPDLEKPATQIYIEGLNGKHEELSRCSDTVEELTIKYTLVRYYFPAEVRDKIDEHAVPLLFKE